MSKSKPSMTYATKIIILAILAIIVGYLVSSGKTIPTSFTQINAPTENIQDEGGLNQAQDELDTINVDSLDRGLNQLY